MKKIIIIYCLIVNLICLIPSLISIIELDFKFNTLFFFIFSLISLIATIFVLINKVVNLSLLFLIITNFLQVFTFVFLGLSYKFLLGPEISFYIFNDGDLSARFSALPYNIIFHVNTFKLDDNYMFGFNFIHVFLFLYFNHLLLLEKKKINSDEQSPRLL
jgi:hypothetical protein